ncbi:MAG: WXG100 family type VII secretion target [Jatrophihabitantaceae bacterium]
MSGFQVNPDDLRAAAEQMANINQAVDAQMNQLMSQLSGLSDLWRGPAAKSFHDAKTSWAARAAKHNQRLAQISEGLMRTHRDYMSTEATNTAGLQRGISSPGATRV